MRFCTDIATAGMVPLTSDSAPMPLTPKDITFRPASARTPKATIMEEGARKLAPKPRSPIPIRTAPKMRSALRNLIIPHLL